MQLFGPATGFKSVYVNLVDYPRVKEKSDEKYKYIQPDLHGNALKALYFVLKLGLVSLPEDDFAQLSVIYKWQDIMPLTKEQKEEILTIFAKIQIAKQGAVCYIGDCIADRRWHDGIFFYLLSHLRRIGLNVKIPISNHDLEFILRLEDKDLTKNVTMYGEHVKSLDNLNKSITNGIFTFEEIKALYLEAYVPCLIAVDYAFVDDGILTITHGIAGEEELPNLAQKWKVEFKDDSNDELIASIDRLNAYFNQQARNLTIHHLVNRDILWQFYDADEETLVIDAKAYPLETIIWNRNPNRVVRKELYKGYKRSYIHGHDIDAPSSHFAINLESENDLGYKAKYDSARMVYYVAFKQKPIPKLIRNYDEYFSDDVRQLSITPREMPVTSPSSMSPTWRPNVSFAGYHFFGSAKDIYPLNTFAIEPIRTENNRRLSQPSNEESCLKVTHPFKARYDISTNELIAQERNNQRSRTNSTPTFTNPFDLVKELGEKLRTLSLLLPDASKEEPKIEIVNQQNKTRGLSANRALANQTHSRPLTVSFDYLQVQPKEKKTQRTVQPVQFSNNVKSENRKKSARYNCKNNHR